MTVTLEEKITAVEDTVKYFAMYGGPTHPRTLVLEAVLADLRAWRAAKVVNDARFESSDLRSIAAAILALPVE